MKNTDNFNQKPHKHDGQETVPDEHSTSGLITAFGIAGAFVTMVALGAVYTEGYGFFDFDDSLPQGAESIPFTIKNEF